MRGGTAGWSTLPNDELARTFPTLYCLIFPTYGAYVRMPRPASPDAAMRPVDVLSTGVLCRLRSNSGLCYLALPHPQSYIYPPRISPRIMRQSPLVRRRCELRSPMSAQCRDYHHPRQWMTNLCLASNVQLHTFAYDNPDAYRLSVRLIPASVP